MDEILGQIGTDEITGFKGVITGVFHYLDGTQQFLIQPKCVNDNMQPVDPHAFDYKRVVVSPHEPPIGFNGLVTKCDAEVEV